MNNHKKGYNIINVYLLSITIILFHFIICTLHSQDNLNLFDSSETISIIPGKEYAAGEIHRLFFGNTWRDLWTTPIKASVLNLDTFDGGLAPFKKGGGMQTQSLKFESVNGKIFKFRAIKKTTERILAPELRKSLVADVLNDIFSTSNPMSALIAAPIINSVGVLQAPVFLCILPDDPKLGEFREEFAGLLGTLEEHPSKDDDDEFGFAESDNVWSTYKLFNKLLKDNNCKVDATEFLKARILDIYLGDWDRHYDQWRWAVYKEDDKTICKPIPRDRDQAFCRYDGIVPTIADYAVIQIEHCGDDYPFIEDLTWSGRYLDRKFLPALTKNTWDSVANHVKSSITDSVIDYAVNRLPKEILEVEGRILRKTLMSRRDKLIDAADEYYKLIFEFVDVRASDKDEYVVINRLDDESVDVSLFNFNKETGEKQDVPFFNRIFDDYSTDEIRLYLFKGDDHVEIIGESENDIDIRIIGGKGNDTFIDKSLTNDYFLGFIPIKAASINNFIYDDKKKSVLDLGNPSMIIDDDYKESKNDTINFEPPVRDWGREWWFDPWFTINSDDGMFLGGGPEYYKFGFRADPFLYRMSFRTGYSILLKKFRADYLIEMPMLFNPLNFFINVYASQMDVLNYFGSGNELDLKVSPKETDYYKVNHSHVFVKSYLEWEVKKKFFLSGGVSLKYVNNDPEKNTYISKKPPYGGENMSLMSAFLNIQYDSRNNERNPEEGIFTSFTGSYNPEIFNNQHPFGMISSEVSAYFSEKIITDVTLSFKIGGQKQWGKTPYFESAFLGGYGSLRGYKIQRFSGDAYVFTNLEARMFLTNHYFLVPGKIGFIMFSDIGRVFVSGETSKLWHYSYGPGFWISAIESSYLLSFYLAKSREQLGYYLHIGFMF
ncbi:BamA/TamA family outer membrane protein [Bacteroidota bacterium]